MKRKEFYAEKITLDLSKSFDNLRKNVITLKNPSLIPMNEMLFYTKIIF